jgi:hypothetical protein
VAHGNSAWGLYVASGAAAIITDSVFTQNSTGIYNDGTLYTRQNNTLVRNNSFSYSGGGVIDPESGF